MATNQIKLVINATDNSSTALKSLANNINNIKQGVVSLSTDTTSATGSLGRMNSSLGKSPGLFSRITQGAKKALTIFGGYKLLTGVFNSISGSMDGAISRLDTMDLFERKMKIITGNANAAAYALEHMKTATKGTAYGLDTAARAVQNFVVRGMSTKQATDSVETWMDAVAVYGNGTNEALTSVINALGKMRSKGTVEMRHINSMINAGINPVQLYAQATGQAAADVQTQLSEKTLRTEEFLAVVENALRTGAGGVVKVTGMAKDMATTWKATFDNMRFALNRGWAAMIDGASELLSVFNESGLKGVFKSFGNASENIMTAIGDSLKSGGATIRAFYEDWKNQNQVAVKQNEQAVEQLSGAFEKVMGRAKESMRTNFLQALSPFADGIVQNILAIRENWERFKVAVAKGVQQIAPQLGQLFGKIFGTGITSATDLMNALLQWATLKLPYFFSWVQEKLQWLIDHWEEVKTLAGYLLKAFIAWKVSSSVARDITKLGLAFLLLKSRLLDIKKIGTNIFNGMFGLDKVNASTIGELNPIVNTANPAKLANMGSMAEVAETESMTVPVTGLQKAGLDIKNALGGVKGYFTESFATSKGIIGDFASYVIESFKAMLNGIKEFVLEGGSLLGKKFGGFFSGIKDAVVGFPKGMFEGLADLGSEGFSLSGIEGFEGGFFTEVLDGLTTLIQKGSEFIGEFFTPIAEGFFELGGTTLDAFVESLTSKISSAFGFVKDLVTGFFSTMFEGFSGLGGESILTGLEGFEGMASSLFPDFNANMFSEIAAGIAESASAVLSLVTSIATYAINIANIAAIIGMFNPGGSVSNAINEFFDGFGEKAMSFGENAKEMIISMGQEFLKNLPTLVSQGVQLVLSVVNGIKTGLPNVLAAGVEIISGLVTSFLQQAPDLVFQGLHAIGEFIAGIFSAIPNVAAAMGNLLKSMASFIITNLPLLIVSGVKIVWSIITGIWSMVSQVGQAIWDLFTGAIDWVKNGGLAQAWDGFVEWIVDCIRDALDNIGAGWVADKLLGEKPATDEAGKTIGEGAGQNAVDGAKEKIDQNDITPNLVDSYTKGQDQINAEASKTGADAANNYLASLTGTVDGADVDVDVLSDETGANVENASTAGTDVGTAYTSGAAEALMSGSESVNAAASNISSQLSLSFDSAAVQQQATDFINTIAIVFTEQAPMLYQTTGNIGVGAVNEFIGKVNENLPLAYATAIGLMSNFKMGIDEGYNGVREALNAGVQTMLMILQQVTTTFYNDGMNSVLQYAQGFSDNATQAALTALQFKTSVLEQMRGIPEATYGIGVSTINSFHNAVVATQGTVINDFTSMVDTLRSGLESQMEQMSTSFNTIAGSMMDEVYATLNRRFTDVKELVRDKREEIENTFHSIITAFNTMGAEMMVSLAKGISDNVKIALDRTSDVVEKLKKTFEEGLGIHSPSDYMIWVGQMMLAGLVQGMTPDDVAKWITSVINDMQSSFAAGSFNPAETMDYLSQQGALDLIAKVTDMDLSAVENAAPTAVPAIVQEALKYDHYQGQGGLNGSSMFGLHYGNPGAWCVSFVRYCAEQVGVPFPATNYVPDVTAWAQANGRWTMTPQPGYAAIFSNRHIELVTDVYPDGRINYIGGNTGHGEVKHRPRSDATGFVALDGGHAVGSTLAATLQNAYNAKYNPMAAMGGASLDGVVGYNPSAGAAQWSNIVLQVLQMLGQPASELNNILYIIDKESSGNPNPPDCIDYNYYHGYPSKGLMQTIPQTFAQYRNPNLSNNILDPMANIYAGINYMIQKYGSIAQTIAKRRGADGRWNGYAVGTRYVPHDMLAMIHEGEAILPAGMNPYSDSGGDYLSDLAQAMFMENNGVTARTGSLTGSSEGSTTVVNMNSPITVNVDGDTTNEELGRNIGEEIHKALMRAIDIGNAR